MPAKKLNHVTTLTRATGRKRQAHVASTDPRLDRLNKGPITGFFDITVKDEFKHLGIELHKTAQQMVGEALNDYFAKHGKPKRVTFDE